MTNILVVQISSILLKGLSCCCDSNIRSLQFLWKLNMNIFLIFFINKYKINLSFLIIKECSWIFFSSAYLKWNLLLRSLSKNLLKSINHIFITKLLHTEESKIEKLELVFFSLSYNICLEFVEQMRKSYVNVLKDLLVSYIILL